MPVDVSPEKIDYVAIGLAVLGLLLKEAPDLFDAFKGGEKDRVAAWLKTRTAAIKARVEFEAQRK